MTNMKGKPPPGKTNTLIGKEGFTETLPPHSANYIGGEHGELGLEPNATQGTSLRWGNRYRVTKEAEDDHWPARRTASKSNNRKNAREEAYFRT